MLVTIQGYISFRGLKKRKHQSRDEVFILIIHKELLLKMNEYHDGN